MKKRLQRLNGQRLTFTATVGRFSFFDTTWGRRPTLVLENLRDTGGTLLADHVWMKMGAWCTSFREGDRVRFDARVAQYTKGYKGRRAEETGEAWHQVDYKLTHPSKVKITRRTSDMKKPTVYDFLKKADLGTPAQVQYVSELLNKRGQAVDIEDLRGYTKRDLTSLISHLLNEEVFELDSITAKQRAFIEVLVEEAGVTLPGLDEYTKHEASILIDNLLKLKKKEGLNAETIGELVKGKPF